MHAYKSFGAQPANITVMATEKDFKDIMNGAFGETEAMD
jgi:putative sterol carrier protein